MVEPGGTIEHEKGKGENGNAKQVTDVTANHQKKKGKGPAENALAASIFVADRERKAKGKGRVGRKRQLACMARHCFGGKKTSKKRNDNSAHRTRLSMKKKRGERRKPTRANNA